MAPSTTSTPRTSAAAARERAPASPTTTRPGTGGVGEAIKGGSGATRCSAHLGALEHAASSCRCRRSPGLDNEPQLSRRRRARAGHRRRARAGRCDVVVAGRHKAPDGPARHRACVDDPAGWDGAAPVAQRSTPSRRSCAAPPPPAQDRATPGGYHSPEHAGRSPRRSTDRQARPAGGGGAAAGHADQAGDRGAQRRKLGTPMRGGCPASCASTSTARRAPPPRGRRARTTRSTASTRCSRSTTSRDCRSR